MVPCSRRRNIREADILSSAKRLLNIARILVSRTRPGVAASISHLGIDPVIQPISDDGGTRERSRRSESSHDHDWKLETLGAVHGQNPYCRLIAPDARSLNASSLPAPQTLHPLDTAPRRRAAG